MIVGGKKRFKVIKKIAGGRVKAYIPLKHLSTIITTIKLCIMRFFFLSNKIK